MPSTDNNLCWTRNVSRVAHHLSAIRDFLTCLSALADLEVVWCSPNKTRRPPRVRWSTGSVGGHIDYKINNKILMLTISHSKKMTFMPIFWNTPPICGG